MRTDPVAYLGFTREWVLPILEGRKTQTLRRPARLPRAIYTGSEPIEARNNHNRPPFARLDIVQIDTVTVEQLTRGDAKREAVPSLKALRVILTDLYGEEPGPLVRIRFVVI